MQGKATIAGHPVHPVLVTFPIGCFVAAVISDLISIWAGTAFWATMSMWLIGFGVTGSLVAAFFGLVDYLSAPMTASAKNVAGWHAILNLSMVVIFGIAFAVRYFTHVSPIGYALTIAGVIVLGVSGYLGGELAHRHLVGSSEEDLNETRTAADQTDLSPQERVRRERETASTSSKGTI